MNLKDDLSITVGSDAIFHAMFSLRNVDWIENFPSTAESYSQQIKEL